MEVRIGVQHASREIMLETDMTADALAKAVAEAVDGATLDLKDTKGRRVVVPSGAIAYVEMDDATKPRVGFGS